MYIKARNHLFLAVRELPKVCYQCNEEIKKLDLCYSKRHRHYYCGKCAFKLGFIVGIK